MELSAIAVGDGQLVGGTGDGDVAAVVQPMVVGAHQHEVGQLGGAAVLPMSNVVSV